MEDSGTMLGGGREVNQAIENSTWVRRRAILCGLREKDRLNLRRPGKRVHGILEYLEGAGRRVHCGT